jgi:hypothetical protein
MSEAKPNNGGEIIGLKYDFDFSQKTGNLQFSPSNCNLSRNFDYDSERKREVK